MRRDIHVAAIWPTHILKQTSDEPTTLGKRTRPIHQTTPRRARGGLLPLGAGGAHSGHGPRLHHPGSAALRPGRTHQAQLAGLLVAPKLHRAQHRPSALWEDSKQAVNRVVKALVASGYFELERLLCPDSGRRCKGLRLVDDESSL